METRYGETLKSRYQNLWDICIVRPERKAEVNKTVARIMSNRDRYLVIENAIGTPWFLVGVVHYMECNLDFSCHLANGDPLSARTVNEPANRPTIGNPPFTWLEAAIDALQYDKMTKMSKKDIPFILWKLESYNGTGYLRRNINSPYLWSYSNHYGDRPNIGKFVKDGIFDQNAISKQCGCAALS
jgi:lysozyme family protein